MAVHAVPIKFPILPKLTPIPSTLTIPAPAAQTVQLRFASLDDRDDFGKAWQVTTLRAPTPGLYQIDLNTLGLPDGTYEYDLVVTTNGTTQIVADPFADELEKFGGYRSVFRIQNGVRVGRMFDWSDEMTDGAPLPNNNQMVIYEMPVRWMATAEQERQVDIGTFEKAVFEHLDDLRALGINAIELLPSQDSADTLNWGYGTRFFFAPDWDMGTSIDMKYFIKRCHQYGIRVLLDVVMNHSRECPLETLADSWFYLPKGSTEEDSNGVQRQDYGGRLFRYGSLVNNIYQSREFQYRMAEFWIRQYHIDGFRIDEFKGINNWDFLQKFHDRAWTVHEQLFADRPFIVIAEDSWRRPEITDDHIYNDRVLVDSMWNFDFRDEIRRLLDNAMTTNFGEPSRRDRIQNMITGKKVWNDMTGSYRDAGFSDMHKTVNYLTSHDVEAYTEQRLLNFHLTEILRWNGIQPGPGETDVQFVKRIVDNIASQPANIQAAHTQALERVGSTFALMLTSAGVPMFLAGEEFGDVHDLEHSDWRMKQSDPVDWERREYLGHKTLFNRVGQLITLRALHPALQRHEVEFFYFHPTIDDNNGTRVFAYCRTGGQPLGSPGQVVVIGNTGPDNFPIFNLPWSWTNVRQLNEYGAPMGAMNPQVTGSTLSLSLAPFQVRVFTT